MTPRPSAAGRAVLVMDWGIGGLATFAGLAERLPHMAIHYLSDSGFTPWGKLEPEALAERISALASPRLGPDDLLVLACNAASTVMDHLRLPRGVEVVGVIGPGVALLEREVRRGRRRLAVLGGARTIASGAHRLGLEGRLSCLGPDPGVTVLELVAQPLSAHVEAGRLDGPALMGDLRPLLAAMQDRGCEAALLACTHYPALLPVLTREAPDIDWLDPVADPRDGLIGAIARTAGFELDPRDPHDTAGAELGPVAIPVPRPDRTVTTTGEPEDTRRAASAAFDLKLPEVHRAF